MSAGLGRFAGAAALVALLAQGRRASAQPTAEDRAAAEALFLEARALAEKGDLEAACPRFEKSQGLDPQVGTLLYVATCHEQRGQTATAWIEFKDALGEAQRTSKTDRIQQATAGIARVEATLSKVTLVVEGALPGEHVRVNGREVNAFDVALPYNPGMLTVEAEAPKRRKHTQTVELPKGPVSITITVPALAEERKAPPPPPKPRDHSLAFIVGGGGLGVAAVGLGFGGAAWATRDAADDDCVGRYCGPDGLAGHDRANAFAWTSNVLLVTGALGAGAGLVLFFVWPPDEARKTGRPLVELEPGGAKIGWTGFLP